MKTFLIATIVCVLLSNCYNEKRIFATIEKYEQRKLDAIEKELEKLGTGILENDPHWVFKWMSEGDKFFWFNKELLDAHIRDAKEKYGGMIRVSTINGVLYTASSKSKDDWKMGDRYRTPNNLVYEIKNGDTCTPQFLFFYVWGKEFDSLLGEWPYNTKNYSYAR